MRVRERVAPLGDRLVDPLLGGIREFADPGSLISGKAADAAQHPGHRALLAEVAGANFRERLQTRGCGDFAARLFLQPLEVVDSGRHRRSGS